jgi:hypothetical protein
MIAELLYLTTPDPLPRGRPSRVLHSLAASHRVLLPGIGAAAGTWCQHELLSTLDASERPSRITSRKQTKIDRPDG